MTRALVREPSSRLADGLITHINRRPVDTELARRQWEGYVAALESLEWEIIAVPSAPDHPDSVFVEDTMVVFGDRAVIANPGARQRRGEIPDAEQTISALGYAVSRIAEPDTLDGGDVLKVADRAYVGVGGRTTASTCERLSELLPDWTIVPVPVTKVLHLKSAVTALPDGTVIGFPPLVDDITAFERFLPVPEEAGSHVIVIDEQTVLMASSAPHTRLLLQEQGFGTISVDISEFEKMEGCVTCLSVRLR